MLSASRKKMIGGTALATFGLLWYTGLLDVLSGWTGVSNLESLGIVFQAWFGVLLLFFGAFLTWIGSDERKVEAKMASQSAPASQGSTVRIDRSQNTENPGSDPVDYDTVVTGTIDDVKDRVVDDDLDVAQVIAAERRGQDRSTLIEWLEQLDR